MAALRSARSTVAIAGNVSAAMDLSAFLSTCCFSGFMKLLHDQPQSSTQG